MRRIGLKLLGIPTIGADRAVKYLVRDSLRMSQPECGRFLTWDGSDSSDIRVHGIALGWQDAVRLLGSANCHEGSPGWSEEYVDRWCESAL
jgi:hypothetical protein